MTGPVIGSGSGSGGNGSGGNGGGGGRDHAGRGPWDGALGRITGAVYWILVVELAFLVAASPTIAGLVLLEPDPSNIPLYALSLVPAGPAFSAAIAALRARQADDDLVVWPRYWRAWWRDLRDVLLVWVPALVVLAVLAVNIAFATAVGIDAVWVVVSIVLAVLVTVITVHAIVIATGFRFRTRDVARLALYYSAAKPLVSLGVLSGVVLSAAVVAFTSGWVLALAAALLAALVLQNAKPMTADIEARFVAAD